MFNNISKKKFLSSLVATMFATAGFFGANSYASAEENAPSKYSAKALFFGEDEVVAVSTSTDDKTKNNSNVAKNATKKKLKVASNKNSSIGASYHIKLLDDNGKGKNVLTSRIFKAGERFKLGLKINRQSYVYIYNKDPNGKETLLYPQPGQDNLVKAMGTVYLPEKGAFQFDDVPGTENLLVYVSDTKQDEIAIMKELSNQTPDIVTASADVICDNNNNSVGQYSSKGIDFITDNVAANNCSNSTANHKFASKDIFFTDDADHKSGDNASYVYRQDSAKLFLNINLKHN